MAVAFMRCRLARAPISTGRIATRAAALRPTAQHYGGEQRPDQRAAQHQKNRNHADMPARRRIAWCGVLRCAGRCLNRQRQNVGGVSRCNRENQVRTSALCEPRRCHPVCAVGTRRGSTGPPGIRLQALRRSPVRWWRTGRGKSRDFRRGQSQRSRTRWNRPRRAAARLPRPAAVPRGHGPRGRRRGRSQLLQSCGHRESTQGTPEMGKHTGRPSI